MTVSSSKGAVAIAVSSLALGGAERIVSDVVRSHLFAGRAVVLFVLYRQRKETILPEHERLDVRFLEEQDTVGKAGKIASILDGYGLGVVVTHLVRVEVLRWLWKRGIKTVTVIHNARTGWQNYPSDYPVACVPLVVACCDTVKREFLAFGNGHRVISIHHRPLNRVESYRGNGRALKCDGPIIGMVGRIHPQKRQERAVEVLSHVRRSGYNAHLVIVGEYDSRDASSRLAHARIAEAVRARNLGAFVHIVGGQTDVSRWLNSFDVFLNCSDYEGYSVATLEALDAGCGCVVSSVGGQGEISNGRLYLVKSLTNIDEYATAICTLLTNTKRRQSNTLCDIERTRYLDAYWSMGYMIGQASAVKLSRTAFVINNLGIGGAQRSLLNLLSAGLEDADPVVVSLSSTNLALLKQYELDVPIVEIGDQKSIYELVAELLERILELRISRIVFWNVRADVKLLLTKFLSTVDCKILDVSPGEAYSWELKDGNRFMEKHCLTADQYLSCIDVLVYKYPGGIPDVAAGVDPKKLRLIRNGVRIPPRHSIGGRKESGCRVGTLTRIHPVKRLSHLLAVAQEVVRASRNVEFIVKGPIDGAAEDRYQRAVRLSFQRKSDRRIQLDTDPNGTNEFLSSLDIFVLISEPGGCPNAALEALATGLPIVATHSKCVADILSDGENGYICSPNDPGHMATRILDLMGNESLRYKFSIAAKKLVKERFSLETMRDQYRSLLCVEGLAHTKRAGLEEQGVSKDSLRSS